MSADNISGKGASSKIPLIANQPRTPSGPRRTAGISLLPRTSGAIAPDHPAKQMQAWVSKINTSWTINLFKFYIENRVWQHSAISQFLSSPADYDPEPPVSNTIYSLWLTSDHPDLMVKSCPTVYIYRKPRTQVRVALWCVWLTWALLRDAAHNYPFTRQFFKKGKSAKNTPRLSGLDLWRAVSRSKNYTHSVSLRVVFFFSYSNKPQGCHVRFRFLDE